MNKKIIFLACMLVLSVMLFANVKAFGVTSAYYDSKPLEISPGQTTEVALGLQNMVGGEDIALVANITSGTEIAQLRDPGKEYLIPYGSNNQVTVGLLIDIPENAPVGTEYSVSVTLTKVTPGQSGGVAMGASIGKNFPVKIVAPTGEAETKAFPILVVVILAVAIAVVVVLVILFRKKKEPAIMEEIKPSKKSKK